MQADRWKQVDELLDAALELGPDERAAMLDAACATDPGLRLEVESLLAAHDRAGGFIEEQAFELAARGLAREHAAAADRAADDTDAVGRGFGHYTILSLLGAGGMGEVYLARDTRLGRRVALKLLPPEYTGDPARVRRFEREARAASALNHPNIVTIYEIGRAEGAYFIATEYVEGRTLRQVLNEARPAFDVAVTLACQIADALSAAHAEGIVHRDVKPENVMVRSDGYVKVLDFGIAKLTEQPPQPGASRHASEVLKTDTGAVLGTAAYMSPEQALGQEVDQRTDIFSLGVVLYELFTGCHPFRGNTTAATFDALLNREPPPLCEHDSGLPEQLGRVVCRALEKQRALRYQTVADLRAELRLVRRDLPDASSLPGGPDAARAPAARTPTTSTPRTRGLRIGLALTALLLVLAGTVAYFASRRARPKDERAPAPARSFNFVKLTEQPGVEHFPSLSPDGGQVAYAARNSGNWDIHAQRVGEKVAVNLTKDSAADETQPAFSPDGQRVAFRSERERGGLYVMPVSGGHARRLTDFGYHPAWSPDGREIVFATHAVGDPNARRLDQSVAWVVNVETGLKRQLTDGRADAAQPSWSPNGARVAYWGKNPAAQRDIWTIPAQGGEPVAVTDDAAFDWNPVWSPDGNYIYFSSDRGGSMNLWRVPLEEQSGRVTGPPEPLTAPSTYAQHVAFSRDGRRAAYVSLVSSTNIMKVAFNPYKEALAGQPVAVTRGSGHASTPNLSPDGEWIVYSSMGEKQEDLFVIDKDGAQPPRQLTDDAHKDRGPVWSPDGTRVAFYSGRSGKYELWTIRPDGSDLRQMTFTGGESVAYPVWSPDAARLCFSRHAESSSIFDVSKPWDEQTVWRLPAPPDRRIDVFWASSWSPDGSRLAGWAGSLSGQTGIVVYDFRTNGFERITEFGSFPVWLRDGRRLLFSHENKLHLVNLETGRVRQIFLPGSDTMSGKAISADNRTILYSLTSTEADIWLLNVE